LITFLVISFFISGVNSSSSSISFTTLLTVPPFAAAGLDSSSLSEAPLSSIEAFLLFLTDFRATSRISSVSFSDFYF
jgi:hypothetical protein